MKTLSLVTNRKKIFSHLICAACVPVLMLLSASPALPDEDVLPRTQKQVRKHERKDPNLHERLRTSAKKFVHGADRETIASESVEEIVNDIEALEVDETETEKRFRDIEEQIKSIGSSRILQRHRQAVRDYRRKATELKKHANAVREAKKKKESPESAKKAVQDLLDFTEKNNPNKYDIKSSESSLPWRVVQPGEIQLLGNADSIPQQSVTTLSTAPPAADDLSSTPDVQITPEIQALADSLDRNPLKIYRYVYNNYHYTPYYGSMKGSLDTYWEKEGNDYDLASLLIALLRASGIPARYVRAKIAVPILTIQKSLGLNDPTSAVNYLSSAQIPVGYYTQGGRISHVGIDHVHVEAYVPYSNYRGTSEDAAGKIWIPLDPGFKEYRVLQEGTDLAEEMKFDWKTFTREYLGDLRNGSPKEFYQSRVDQYIASNYPGKTINDLKRITEIRPMQFDFLPNTLPYIVTQELGRYASIPSEQRHTVSFNMPSFMEYSTTLPEIAGRRITLSFAGATPEDQEVIDFYGGIFRTPPYLIEIKPVLRVNGASVAEGTAMRAGGLFGFSVSYTQPGGKREGFGHTVTAGSYNAVAITIGKVRPELLDIANVEESEEPYLAKMLHSLGMKYHHSDNEMKQVLDDSMKMVSTTFFSEALVSTHENAGRVYGGIATSFGLAGFKIDAKSLASAMVAVDGDNGTKSIAYGMVGGYEGSYQENKTFEDSMFWVSGLSAVKALQVLNAEGVWIQELRPPYQYWNPYMPQMVIADINSALNQGWNVIVPFETRGLPTIPYIKYDPKTGSAGYMISTMAGGFNAYLEASPELLDSIALHITWSGPKMLLSSNFVALDPPDGKTFRLGESFFVQFKLVLKWKEGGNEWTQELLNDSNGQPWGLYVRTGPGLYSYTGVPLPWWNSGQYSIKYNGNPVYNFNLWGVSVESVDNNFIAITSPGGVDSLSKPLGVTYSISNFPSADMTAASLKVHDASGTEVRNQALPLTLGSGLKTTWDGKNNTGQLVTPGEYSVRIEAIGTGGTLQSDPVKVTLFKIEIENPHGSPTTAPQDNANEFTFNTANPGVLTVECRAKVTPNTAGVLSYLGNNKIRWTITAVGNSALTWNSSWPADTAKGNGLVAKATFTGLPANNSDFGQKTVTMEVMDGANVASSQTATIEVFYDMNAKNHPGGQAGSTNWFHYWLQALGGRPNTVYGGSSGNYGVTPGMYNWSYFLKPDKTKLIIFDTAATSDIGSPCADKGQKMTTGIDTFEDTLLHENHHAVQIAQADAVVGIVPNTPWQYGWSWNQGLKHNHYTVGADGKPGRAGVDDDGDGKIDNFIDYDPGELGKPGSDDVVLHDTGDPLLSWPLAFGPLPTGCWAGNFAIEDPAYNVEPDNEDQRLGVDWGNPGKQHATRAYND